ncbi:hypothetical protein CA223_05325 [Sphingomonas koreensis]|uniref:Uncharacterized protein n=1 Tax=Sphingomonas koreensis TaxID=93064 RepID=A0A1L6JBX9_9SPHN|nr:hypothetical protein [Sphingomonas koreensis]APR53337.1 hypothetical protein BRX40_13680 [Sphingomonas koreensis]MDC7809972.1 hypothetical protein [Sphingomonas koreensis]RSU24543.1 hypothetical protein CA224_02155 [Sphingomonas koreensis]RSU25188.1 hypothetical protein CA222_13750 [Sphingomonas koreensis]RSU30137.1 hypothetical protein CA225_05600 [Sphingomonas koreensis]
MSDAFQAALKARRDRAGPPPVILSKAEAFEFAASQLDQMAHTLDLACLIDDTMRSLGDPPADIRSTLEALRRETPEPNLQAKAIRAAVADLRELVIQERLQAARIAGAGVR